MSAANVSDDPAGTLLSMLKTSPAIDLEADALWLDNEHALTYRTLFAMVDCLAGKLRNAGASTTTRIAFPMPRGATSLVGFLAASEVGICCPFDAKLRDEELAAAVDALGVSMLMLADGTERLIESADARGISVVHFGLDELVLNDDVGNPATISAVDADRTRVALMMQTSGTTSKPKAVGLTHSNVAAAAVAIGRAFSLGPTDLCVTPMPLHHVHGLISAAMTSLFAGSSIRCVESFLPAAFDTACRALRPTWFTASPAAHLSLREFYSSPAARLPRGRLRFFRASSAPLPPSAIVALEEIFGVPLIETYGLTESASMICSNPLPPMRRKIGSIGIPFGAEIRIADQLGQTRGPDIEGEILVRGPSIITRYMDQDVNQSQSFWGDWLRTGDIGKVDPDGYFYICGRIKELIKRGGHSVFPTEVDDVLCQHDSVAEAVTFSVAHATLGEDVVAAVVARAGSTLSEEALRSFVASRLSTYKVPSVMLVVDDIPKNAMGKVTRREMARHFAARLSPTSAPCGNPMEEHLLSLWRRLLGRTDIGATDNVFLFGGDPLNAERIVTQLTQGGQWPTCTFKALAAYPTVRAQALQCSQSASNANVTTTLGEGK